MKNYIIYGFTKSNVFGYVELKTLPNFVALRAAEKGIVNITYIEEV